MHFKSHPCNTIVQMHVRFIITAKLSASGNGDEHWDIMECMHVGDYNTCNKFFSSLLHEFSFEAFLYYHKHYAPKMMRKL